MSVESFTIPKSAHRVEMSWIWLGSLAGVAMLAYMETDLSLITLAAIAGITCGSACLIHMVNARLVWVTLSDDCIRGRHGSWDLVTLTWQEPVSIRRRREFDRDGIVLQKAGTGGESKRDYDWFFIPASLLECESFAAALSRFAPPSHPLRRELAGAT
jgi:hypothetical protein